MDARWGQPLNTVGVGFMDAEHEGIMAILAKLSVVVESPARGPLGPLGLLLERLTAAVADHFVHEQEQMLLSGYPLTGVHTAQHARFLAELDRLCIEYDVAEVPPTAHLVDFVESWFVHHIDICDERLAAWLIAAGAEAGQG